MAAPISIDIASNTREFQAGTKDVAKGLDSVADALDDLTRDAQKAGAKVGASLSDGAQDATKANDKLERSFRDIADSAKRESKRAGDDVGDNIKRGSHEASEGLDEIKDSGKSNAIEVAASFDGSAQSIADGFQGLAAEAFAGFGPAGVVAGVAAAAGIGLISSALEGAQEDADVTAERVTNMFLDMAESGKNYVSQDFKNQSIQDIISDTKRYEQANKDAQESGASLSTILNAMSGDTDALAQVQAQATAKQAALTAQQEAYKIETGDTSAQIDAQGYSLVDLKERYSAVAGQTDTAASKARAYNDAISGTGPLADASKAKVDDLGRSLNNLPQPRKVVFDVDDSAIRAAIDRIQNTNVRVAADVEFRSGGRVL